MPRPLSKNLRSGQARFTLVQLLVVIGLVAMISTYVLLASHRTYDSSYRLRCHSNLMQIGNGLILYTNENNGAFPRTHAIDGAPISQTNDGFADADAFLIPPTGGKINNIPQAMFLLIRQEDLTPAVFNCVSGDAVADTMAGQPATRRSNFTGDGLPGGAVIPNVSYSFVNVYPTSAALKLGYLLKINNGPSDFPLAADLSPADIGDAVWPTINLNAPRLLLTAGNSPNHDGDGQNVLYADGHVEFQQTPLCGVAGDNLYTPQDTSAAGLPRADSATGADPDPRSATDSVLLLHAK